jgi:hypothetical protein
MLVVRFVRELALAVTVSVVGLSLLNWGLGDDSLRDAALDGLGLGLILGTIFGVREVRAARPDEPVSPRR